MERLAGECGKILDGDLSAKAPRYLIPGIVPRNLLFLLIVLAHGVRRMFPPYA
jgi:hypothetical protein